MPTTRVSSSSRTASGRGSPASTCSPGPEPSVRRAPGDDREHGQEQDLDVEPERPVLDVVVVPLDPVGEGRLAAEAVDLGPAGDPRLDAVPFRVAVDASLEALDVVHPLGTRADERHLADEDVPELRQLVEREAPEEASDARAALFGDRLLEVSARKLLVGPVGVGLAGHVGPAAHGAELDHPEGLPVAADAQLPE